MGAPAPAPALASVLKIVFSVLGCVMLADAIYTIAIDGLPFQKGFLSPWMAATQIDFLINNIITIGAWIVYKESSNWILGVVWIVLLVCFGSITTCVYIVLQLLHLSPQESLQHPIHFVLLGQKDKGGGGGEGKSIFTVLTARVVFCVLGCLMLGSLVYTIVTDGSPFRKDLLTPWLSSTLVDIYISVITLSVWVAYKESSLISSAFWIVLFICFGSISTCAYIVLHLFSLSSQDPAYLVLFRSSNSYLQSIPEAISDADQLMLRSGY